MFVTQIPAPTSYASALAVLRADCPAYLVEDRCRKGIADATAFMSKWGAQARRSAGRCLTQEGERGNGPVLPVRGQRYHRCPRGRGFEATSSRESHGTTQPQLIAAEAEANIKLGMNQCLSRAERTVCVHTDTPCGQRA